MYRSIWFPRFLIPYLMSIGSRQNWCSLFELVGSVLLYFCSHSHSLRLAFFFSLPPTWPYPILYSTLHGQIEPRAAALLGPNSLLFVILYDILVREGSGRGFSYYSSLTGQGRDTLAFLASVWLLFYFRVLFARKEGENPLF